MNTATNNANVTTDTISDVEDYASDCSKTMKALVLEHSRVVEMVEAKYVVNTDDLAKTGRLIRRLHLDIRSTLDGVQALRRESEDETSKFRDDVAHLLQEVSAKRRSIDDLLPLVAKFVFDVSGTEPTVPAASSPRESGSRIKAAKVAKTKAAK